MLQKLGISDMPIPESVRLLDRRAVVGFRVRLYIFVTITIVSRALFMIVPCNIGNAKAAVFPLPVSASPIKSCPFRASGIASFCIGVGVLYPKAVHASHSESITPSS